MSSLSRLSRPVLKMQNKKHILHCDVESVGGFGGGKSCAPLIWAVGYVVTDLQGNKLKQGGILIKDALPFLGGDQFWSKRKNAMQIGCLSDYVQMPAVAAWEHMQTLMDGCDIFCAFNSRFEYAAFAASSRGFKLEPLRFPYLELDLAQYALEALPLSRYVVYALEHKLTTPAGNISAKCENLLAWLGLIENEHNHLALSDTLSQVDLYIECEKAHQKRPYGVRLHHVSSPIWRKYFKRGNDEKIYS